MAATIAKRVAAMPTALSASSPLSSLSFRLFHSARASFASLPEQPLPRPGRQRWHYARVENTATFQAARRITKSEAVDGEGKVGQEVPLEQRSPIDAEEDDTRNVPAHSASRAVEAPAGSVVYSGPSAVPLAPVPEHLFHSVAIRDASTSSRKHIGIAPQKLNDICRTVRGVSVQEAMIQLKLSHKKKAYIVRQTIANAAGRAVNDFNMERTRLYISKLWVGQGSHLKRIDIKGRGRTGMKRKYRSHLYCEVREQGRDAAKFRGVWKYGGNSHSPHSGEELRIGRVGRRISSIERTLAEMKTWRTERGMAPVPDKALQQRDISRAFRAAGVATDLEAAFGPAAVEAAKAQAEAASSAQQQ